MATSSYKYDPSLDAQARAVWRGLAYATQGANTAQSRALEDYGVGTAAAQEQSGWNTADNQTSYQRQMEDIAQGRQRTGEDYQHSIAALQRSYQQLANKQGQQQRQQGILAGGAVLAAARRRASNQAWDRQPIDTSYQRAMQDYDTQQARDTQDFQSAQQRGQSSLNDQLGALGLTLTRSQADIGNQLSQQQIEAQQFGIDNAAEMDFYKQLAGY